MKHMLHSILDRDRSSRRIVRRIISAKRISNIEPHTLEDLVREVLGSLMDEVPQSMQEAEEAAPLLPKSTSLPQNVITPGTDECFFPELETVISEMGSQFQKFPDYPVG